MLIKEFTSAGGVQTLQRASPGCFYRIKFVLGLEKKKRQPRFDLKFVVVCVIRQIHSRAFSFRRPRKNVSWKPRSLSRSQPRIRVSKTTNNEALHHHTKTPRRPLVFPASTPPMEVISSSHPSPPLPSSPPPILGVLGCHSTPSSPRCLLLGL